MKKEDWKLRLRSMWAIPICDAFCRRPMGSQKGREAWREYSENLEQGGAVKLEGAKSQPNKGNNINSEYTLQY